MGYIILGVALGIGVAFACMMFFCRGIKVGMAVERDEPESVLPSFREKEVPDEKDVIPEELQRKIDIINNYDPYKD